MDLFIIVLSILFLQVWGADNPLHKDGWLVRWTEYLKKFLVASSAPYFLVSVILPVVGLSLIFGLLYAVSYWLILPLGIVVLLYSFGRGEFSELVQEYTQACYNGDWEAACVRAEMLGVVSERIPALTAITPEEQEALRKNSAATQAEMDRPEWQVLHLAVLREASYRGFERMFAVLFWCFLLGPAGAFMYRLTFLFIQKNDAESPLADLVLRFMEWPAARVLAMSFAITGNFVSCYKSWRKHMLNIQEQTRDLLSRAIFGALSVADTTVQTVDITQKELALLDRLYVRTLWFWLCAVAILTLIF